MKKKVSFNDTPELVKPYETLGNAKAKNPLPKKESVKKPVDFSQNAYVNLTTLISEYRKNPNSTKIPEIHDLFTKYMDDVLEKLSHLDNKNSNFVQGVAQNMFYLLSVTGLCLNELFPEKLKQIQQQLEQITNQEYQDLLDKKANNLKPERKQFLLNFRTEEDVEKEIRERDELLETELSQIQNTLSIVSDLAKLIVGQDLLQNKLESRTERFVCEVQEKPEHTLLDNLKVAIDNGNAASFLMDNAKDFCDLFRKDVEENKSFIKKFIEVIKEKHSQQPSFNNDESIKNALELLLRSSTFDDDLKSGIRNKFETTLVPQPKNSKTPANETGQQPEHVCELLEKDNPIVSFAIPSDKLKEFFLEEQSNKSKNQLPTGNVSPRGEPPIQGIPITTNQHTK